MANKKLILPVGVEEENIGIGDLHFTHFDDGSTLVDVTMAFEAFEDINLSFLHHPDAATIAEPRKDLGNFSTMSILGTMTLRLQENGWSDDQLDLTEE